MFNRFCKPTLPYVVTVMGALALIGCNQATPVKEGGAAAEGYTKPSDLYILISQIKNQLL